jgi:hypothetical protein
VERILNVVLTVHVFPRMGVSVVELVTVNQMKGVAMMSVFHKISVVMTHTAASEGNVVLIKRVPHQVSVVGYYTVYQKRPAARTLNAVNQTKPAARQAVSAVHQTGPVARTMVSVAPQARAVARRAIAAPQAKPAAMTLFVPNPVSPAVVVTLSADRVKSVVLMVVVKLQDRVHVVQTWTVQVGISVVIITVVGRVKDVVLMVRAELAKDVV